MIVAAPAPRAILRNIDHILQRQLGHERPLPLEIAHLASVSLGPNPDNQRHPRRLAPGGQLATIAGGGAASARRAWPATENGVRGLSVVGVAGFEPAAPTSRT